MKSMLSRRFRHNNLIYEFKWAKMKQVMGEMPPSLQKKLLHYFQRIIEDRVPYDLFEDRNLMRCSSFRTKGLKRGVQKLIGGELIEEGHISLITSEIIQNSSDDSVAPWIKQLISSVDEVYEYYRGIGMPDFKPGHDPILNQILLTNEYALSLEIPIWTRKQTSLLDFIPIKGGSLNFSFKKSITGHIDLLLYDPIQQCPVVVDYKPEGSFLRSMPQVATYGLLLKRILGIPKLLCVSFKRDEAWLYDPEILRHELEEKLVKFGNPKLPWRKFVKNL